MRLISGNVIYECDRKQEDSFTVASKAVQQTDTARILQMGASGERFSEAIRCMLLEHSPSDSAGFLGTCHITDGSSHRDLGLARCIPGDSAPME